MSGMVHQWRQHARRRWASTLAAAAGVIAVLLAILTAGSSLPAVAQGFSWPWESERPQPVPREPVYREPAREAPAPSANGWEPRDASRNSICLRLEQRLVQEGQRGSQSREQLPQIEGEIRQLDREVRKMEAKLERADCYEWFIFTKQLRNTRACQGLAKDLDEAKRRLSSLQSERQQLQASSGQSYQDDIIRELARNGCGSSYQQEARRRDSSPFSSLWQDEDGGGGYGARYNALPFATYRTLCVRLCDGYYFPVSFSTLPNHFQRDADVCQSKCAAPAQLYYYQNPGGAVDQMVAADTNERYTKLKTAFLYRKEYVQGCSCKEAEYLPKSTPGQKQAGETSRAGPQIGDALDPWRPR
ncbi:MAG: DUF2865 domain-containing protein [Hyphomicrobiaceae bacterium]